MPDLLGKREDGELDPISRRPLEGSEDGEVSSDSKFGVEMHLGR